MPILQLDIRELLLIMGIPSATTGLGFWLLQKSLNKKERKQEEKDKAREKNEVLLIKSVGAAITLGEATALAIRNGKCNGEIDAALSRAKEVMDEQQDFMTEQGVKHLH